MLSESSTALYYKVKNCMFAPEFIGKYSEADCGVERPGPWLSHG